MNTDSIVFTVCGCRGSFPVSGKDHIIYGGCTSCYILRRGDYAIVVDCGSGLFNAAPALEGCAKIDILLTHLHFDHVMGLLDWSSFPRTAEMRVVSVFDSDEYNKLFKQTVRPPLWPYDPSHPVERVTTEFHRKLTLCDGVSVSFLPAPHPDNSSVIYIDFLGKRIHFLTDFEHNETFPENDLPGSDLLIYDGTFTDDEYPAVKGWGHSTWQEACRLANRVRPARLLITHHSPKRKDAELLELEKLAKHEYPDAVFARDGMTITL